MDHKCCDVCGSQCSGRGEKCDFLPSAAETLLLFALWKDEEEWTVSLSEVSEEQQQ